MYGVTVTKFIMTRRKHSKIRRATNRVRRSYPFKAGYKHWKKFGDVPYSNPYPSESWNEAAWACGNAHAEIDDLNWYWMEERKLDPDWDSDESKHKMWRLRVGIAAFRPRIGHDSNEYQ